MHRTSTKVLLIVAAFALFLVPVAAIAVGPTFTDVPPTDWAYDDVEWLAAESLTNGCTSDGTLYCPDEPVTRREMAAFTHRLAVNKVVDAATAVEADNADTLDGKDSTAFAASGHDHDTAYLSKTGKAADASLLDGKNSTVFVQKGEANSVSSSMVTDSAGVAQASVQSPIDFYSATVDLLAVQIEVPAAGYVLVQSTYMALIDHANGSEDKCAFDVSNVTETRPTDIAPHIIVPASAPTGLHSFVSAAARVYPVAGAGTYTFYFVGQEVGAGASCRVANTALTALFVPVAYGDI